jgi:heat shock protein HslJ
VPADVCTENTRLVGHLSYDDKNMADVPVVRPGRQFVKSWRIQNTGTCAWDPGYTIAYVDGNHMAAHMNGAPIALHGQTLPGETYDIEVKLVAPREPGLYMGFWQMRNASGVYFGERLPAVIQVPSRPTPAPTSTPLPVTTIQFNVDRNRVLGGECATFSWQVAQAQAVYFYSEGEAWQAHGVPFVAQRKACPDQTTTYYMRVVRASGWVDVRRLVLHVEQPPEAPQIARFAVEPAQIVQGGCVTLGWEVAGQVTQVRVLRNEGFLWRDAPPSGSMSDCPPGVGEAIYTLEAAGPGGTTRAQRTARLGATPTPTPEPLSGTEWQVLAIGDSMPAPAALPLTVLFGLQDAAGQGTVAGWGGCNTYGAIYRQSGALLTIGAPTAGSNTCEASVMTQEKALFDALHAVATLSRGGGQLTLWNHAGEVVLNLAASEAAGP